jgi:hypothetical protein
MGRHEVGRIDRPEVARFWKVSFEMGSVNLDVRQISAIPAAVLHINDFRSVEFQIAQTETVRVD